jgi:hypothetical protein
MTEQQIMAVIDSMTVIAREPCRQCEDGGVHVSTASGRLLWRPARSDTLVLGLTAPRLTIAQVCNTLHGLEFGKGKSAHTSAGTDSAAENSRVRKTPHATKRGAGRSLQPD